MLNHCTFIGNVGRDPEIRTLTNGTKLAKFSIAVTETWKDKAGEKQQKTEWIEITCFGNLSNVIEQYVKKGDKLFCAGRWTTNSWENDAGEKRYKTELNLRDMQMLGSKQQAASSVAPASAPAYDPQAVARAKQNTQASAPPNYNPAQGQEEVDDLPF